MLSPEQQLEEILDGTEEVLPVEELKAKLERAVSKNEPLKIKYGVDPTAPDLHLGHAVPLRKLRQFQDLGHSVVLLIGDFTARVGDPSERSATRPQLSPELIKQNAKTYTEQAFKILDRAKTVIDWNGRWFGKMTFEEVLRLAAQFTVARLLERDDFANRFAEEVPIGLHEFLYPVMQGYDSVVLEDDVEMGGTDQKFNMLAGRDLQRAYGQEPQVVVTMPILEGTDGVKRMSKSTGNYIGLTELPEEMFGKVMSIPDFAMVKYFRLATNVPKAEVDTIEKGLAADTLHPGETKRRLAREIVSIYHGAQEAEQAERIFDAKFKKAAGTSAERLAAVGEAAIPEVDLSGEPRKDGKIWVVTLIRVSGSASTNSEARRLILQGAVKLNDRSVESAEAELPVQDGDILQVGKRRVVRLRLR